MFCKTELYYLDRIKMAVLNFTYILISLRVKDPEFATAAQIILDQSKILILW